MKSLMPEVEFIRHMLGVNRVEVEIQTTGTGSRASRHNNQGMEETLNFYDPFVGVNSQNVVYAETPCWSSLKARVPSLLRQFQSRSGESQ